MILSFLWWCALGVALLVFLAAISFALVGDVPATIALIVGDLVFLRVIKPRG